MDTSNECDSHKKCDLNMSIFGAILNRCWKCFKMYAQTNPESLHYTMHTPKKSDNTECVDIRDRHGNIIRKGEVYYFKETVMDLLYAMIVDFDIFDEDDFIYKSLECAIKANVARSPKHTLFNLFQKMLDQDFDGDDDIDPKTIRKILKLIHSALEYGWQNTIQNQDDYIMSWFVYLIKMHMHLAEDKENYFILRKIVWKLLENGETFTEEHISYLRRNIEEVYIPQYRFDIYMEKHSSDDCDADDVREKILEEYIEILRSYISEYYSQECMKEPE